MTYKGMLLSALLAPITIMSYGKNTVDPKVAIKFQMEQLKEKRFQKESELSEIGAKIDKTEDVIADMCLRGNRYIQKLADDRDLSEQDFEIFLKEMNESRKVFEKRIHQIVVTRQDVKQRLVVELFEGDTIVSQFLKDEDGDFENIKPLKIYLVREIFEKNFRKSLLERYEKCLQELIEIDRELDVLQKKIDKN